jgi:hypothetical protein
MKLTDEQWIKLTRNAVDYMHSGQRLGQSYMNALYEVNPDVYSKISNGTYDPYHDDTRISAFINYLNCSERVMTIEQQIQVQEILTEAKQYGLEWEVTETASRFFKEDHTLTHVEAYNMAYNEWIK